MINFFFILKILKKSEKQKKKKKIEKIFFEKMNQNGNNKIAENRVLFLGSLPPNIHAGELIDYFQRYGKICNAYTRGIEKNGYCRIEYAHIEDARAAFVNGRDVYFHNKKIRVQYGNRPIDGRENVDQIVANYLNEESSRAEEKYVPNYEPDDQHYRPEDVYGSNVYDTSGNFYTCSWCPTRKDHTTEQHQYHQMELMSRMAHTYPVYPVSESPYRRSARSPSPRRSKSQRSRSPRRSRDSRSRRSPSPRSSRHYHNRSHDSRSKNKRSRSPRYRDSRSRSPKPRVYDSRRSRREEIKNVSTAKEPTFVYLPIPDIKVKEKEVDPVTEKKIVEAKKAVDDDEVAV
jgi:RNA recognition motif-containing protein